MEQDKKYLVVGMGKSGVAAAEVLTARGADVSVYDKQPEEKMDPQLLNYLKIKGIRGFFAQDPEEIDSFDCLIMSPGAPLSIPFVQAAKEAGAEIIGELELAWRLGKGKYVAITGTNGKTTTTTLVGEIFRNARRRTEVAGNIGVAVVKRAVEADEDTWMVTETSSFQLETIDTFHPIVSALLNVTPDHLDRHGNLENYAAAKARIFENQCPEDYFVVNYDDETSWKLTSGCRARVVPFSRKAELPLGAFVRDERIVILDEEAELSDICGVSELIIPGAHNLENALAAAAISYFSGVEPEVIGKTLREFQGVEHRLEFAGEVNGVRYVNDSKGTNPDAAIKALEAMKTGVVLIAGGYDKKASFEGYIRAFDGKVRYLLLLGDTAEKIAETARFMDFTDIVMCRDMEECVRKGSELARPGDTVLLSPACASWDMYDSYEQRGRHFKDCVRRLER
ncbi:UDP-N-acetylmuramoyl-L-alanine--D-glutamate ligase [Bacilliculturomica massiliensis]|uniref:UDP-N-acetylmuramoyl-L-alanine--D-glutamate ligase n=1 Tax=Bacilliculturomica massiliensis TaxID=1917867 RepID=UPI00102FEF03|nr:UDP-N-acetylmuramoyl-L-alanine--D-glutamate ligase [Bacilliculturomica massiliensis]